MNINFMTILTIVLASIGVFKGGVPVAKSKKLDAGQKCFVG